MLRYGVGRGEQRAAGPEHELLAEGDAQGSDSGALIPLHVGKVLEQCDRHLFLFGAAELGSRGDVDEARKCQRCAQKGGDEWGFGAYREEDHEAGTKDEPEGPAKVPRERSHLVP